MSLLHCFAAGICCMCVFRRGHAAALFAAPPEEEAVRWTRRSLQSRSAQPRPALSGLTSQLRGLTPPPPPRPPTTGCSTEPGLSAYAGKPEEAAASLAPLVEAAIAEIPADQLANTHVMLGATAGLRLLPGSQAEEILAAARTYLKNETPFIVRRVGLVILVRVVLAVQTCRADGA